MVKDESEYLVFKIKHHIFIAFYLFVIKNRYYLETEGLF